MRKRELIPIDEEELKKIIIDSDLYQAFISENVDYSSTEKKLAHAIASKFGKREIPKEITECCKVCLAFNQTTNLCNLKGDTR